MLRRVVFEEVYSFLFLEDLEALRAALGHPRGSRRVEIPHQTSVTSWTLPYQSRWPGDPVLISNPLLQLKSIAKFLEGSDRAQLWPASSGYAKVRKRLLLLDFSLYHPKTISTIIFRHHLMHLLVNATMFCLELFRGPEGFQTHF